MLGLRGCVKILGMTVVELLGFRGVGGCATVQGLQFYNPNGPKDPIPVQLNFFYQSFRSAFQGVIVWL